VTCAQGVLEFFSNVSVYQEQNAVSISFNNLNKDSCLFLYLPFFVILSYEHPILRIKLHSIDFFLYTTSIFLLFYFEYFV